MFLHPSIKKTKKDIYHLATKYNKDPTAAFCGTIWDNKTNSHLLFKMDSMTEFVSHPFEDTMILVSKNYEEILRTQFGDWKTIPKETERQKSCHEIAILDITKDYKDYLK